MLPKAIDDHLEQEARLRAHRDLVHAAEEKLREHAVDPPKPEHLFADGVYARTVVLPAGTFHTGRIHKQSQINIIVEGEISVLMEHGEVRLQAPAYIVSPPGTKRLVYAHTRTTWTTIVGTHETDVAKVEATLMVDTEDEYQRHIEQAHKLLEIE